MEHEVIQDLDSKATRPVGSCFEEYDHHVLLKVVEEKTCKGCFYEHKKECPAITGQCSSCCREDGKNVIFVKVS